MFKLVSLMMVMAFISVAQAADKPQQLTGDDLKTAIEMNKVYAQHMYSSSCIDQQKTYGILFDMPDSQKAELMAQFKKSCDCMANLVMKNALPNDVISFVAVTSGQSAPNANGKEPSDFEMQKIGKIMSIERNENNRRNCGFKQ